MADTVGAVGGLSIGAFSLFAAGVGCIDYEGEGSCGEDLEIVSVVAVGASVVYLVAAGYGYDSASKCSRAKASESSQ